MTKCKLCNVEISDGSEYCDNCLKNNKEKQSESYLDSLLNSVVHNNNANQSVSIINNNAIIGDIKSTGLKQDNKNSSELKLDKALENEEYKYEESNNEDSNHEETYQEEANNDYVNLEKPNYEMINHIENNYDETNYDKNNFDANYYKVNNESLINNNDKNNFRNTIAEDINTNKYENGLNNQEPEEFEESTDDDLMALLDMITGLEKSDSKNFNEIKFEEDDNSFPTNDSMNDLHEEDNLFKKNNESKSKDDLYIVEDDTIHFINDLDFNGSDTENNLMYDSKTTDGIDAIDDLNYNDDINALDDLNSLKEINSFNDLSSLNNSDSSDEHNYDSNINSSSDIISIDDFIYDKLSDINERSSRSSNFGDVYSDSLSAVDSLADIDLPVDLSKSKIKKKSLFQKIFETLNIKKSKKEEPFNENIDSSNNSEDIKIKNNKNNDKLNAKNNDKLNAKKNNKFNTKKKDKLSFNQNENQNKNQNEKLNDRQNDKLTDKKNNKKNAKKNSNKKENIKNSKSKLNKGNTNQSDDTENSDVALTDVKKKGKKSANKNGIKASKEESETSKVEKNASKADKKAKVSTKKNKDSNIIIDELENADGGKINKVGASILFAMCGILAAIVILGTNIYSYSLNIKRAATELDRQRYTEAYKQVYGLKVDASDKELYDKIITVMYVDKELDSYHNYKDMGKYPEALDSLLKGLERYQKYKEVAKSLGIKNDIDTIHKQIVTELKNQFNITEKQGMLLINMDDQVDYSNQIFDIATKKLD